MKTLLAVLVFAALPVQGRVEFCRDLDNAKSKANADWRPICAVFYGAKDSKDPGAARKSVDEWFKNDAVIKAAEPFACVLLSISGDKKLADEYKVSTGPITILFDPTGKEIQRPTVKDAAALASALSTCARDYTAVETRVKKTVADSINVIRNNRTREVILAATLHPKDCDDCKRFLELFKHRRLVVPLRRTYLVKFEWDADKDAAAAFDLAESHVYTILAPPDKEGETPRVLFKSTRFTQDVKRLQEVLNAAVKTVVDGK